MEVHVPVDASPGALFYTTLACIIGGLVLCGGAALTWKWQREIQRRVQQAKSEVMGRLVMTRRKKVRFSPSGRSRIAAQLDLSETYKEYLRQNYPEVEVMSLGEYLDSLQPGACDILPQEDLDTLLAAALIRVLGPNLGGALIPALGALPLSAKQSGMPVVAKVDSVNKNEESDKGTSIDRPAPKSRLSHVGNTLSGTSLISILGATDIARSLTPRANGDMDGTISDESRLLTLLMRGESESPTFDDLPNPFILSEHWHTALQGLEEKIKEANGGVYKPDEYPSVEPTPVQEALLPDLYIGTGSAVRTHTNRQILRNRLFSIMMNRLASNILLDEVPGLVEFTVQLAPGKDVITYPAVLIKALIDSGHKVRARSSCRVTTFGFALCVKGLQEQNEPSSGWTHIPLAMPLRSGIQTSDRKEVPGYLTLSCTDIAISGPVLDGILIESYHNKTGFAGWISGDRENLPFLLDSVSHEINPVRATQLSSLLNSCINSIAMRMKLPNGGYGTFGACSDSAAVIDVAVRGTTHIYPLLLIGGVYSQVISRSTELIARLKTMKKLPPDTLETAILLQKTLADLPNDIHPIPKAFPDIVRRILSSMPEVPQFIEMEDTIRILKEEFAA